MMRRVGRNPGWSALLPGAVALGGVRLLLGGVNLDALLPRGARLLLGGVNLDALLPDGVRLLPGAVHRGAARLLLGGVQARSHAARTRDRRRATLRAQPVDQRPVPIRKRDDDLVRA